VNSQSILTQGQRVRTVINSKGDTLIEMSIKDARYILTDVLNLKNADSIIVVLKKMDSLNTSTIILQKNEIDLLNKKSNNQKSIIDNLDIIIKNKDKEIKDKDSIIGEQKKEIRKQKFLKIIGFTTSVVLPIAVLILTL